MKALSLNTNGVRRLLLCIGICMAIVVFSTTQVTHAAASDQKQGAYIRVIHASPDIGIVDVFVDGKKLLSNFQFATVTAYIPIPSGSHTVQLALIGKGAGAAIVSQSMAVQPGTSYTVAALGVKAGGFSFSVFADNNTIVDNGARVRVYHLSPGTGSAKIQTQDQTITRDIAYPQASSYVSLPGGKYAFKLSADAGKNVLTSTLTLKPWTVTSIFAIGVAQGHPDLRFVTSTQQGLPGMPQTGSDPTAKPASSYPTWMFALLGLLVVGISVGSWHARSLAIMKAPAKRPAGETTSMTSIKER